MTILIMFEQLSILAMFEQLSIESCLDDDFMCV